MSDAYKKYICKTCGLIYDEAEGDPDSGLAPGTRFEDIPDDWYCPLCLVSKSDFILLEEKKKEVSELPKRKVSNKADVVIIGSGYGGWQAAEAIRQEIPDIEVTLITADDGTVYPKPALSIALSQGRSVEDLKEATAQQKAVELDIGVKVRTKVMSINVKRKKVTTTTGSFSYDKLILATGAKALLPKLKGTGVQDVITLNDLGAYRKFRGLLDENQSVAIIGGGLIGTELAEDIASTGKKVKLIVRDSHLMAPMLPEAIAINLEHKLLAKGVEIQFNSEVLEVNQTDSGYQLIKSCGGLLEAEMVIAAIGIRPNIDLAKKMGLKTQAGIYINEFCQTSDEDVYALGDCAESVAGVQAYLEPIRRQARTIAKHIKGETSETFRILPPLVKTKTPSLSIMLSPPLRNGPHGDWEMTMQLGNDQKLVYKNETQMLGFALSGECVTMANELYQQLSY